GLVQPKREHYSQSPFNISSRIRSYSSSGSGSRLNSSAISGQIRSHSSGGIPQEKSSSVIASAPPLLDSTRSRRCRRRTGRHPSSDERRTVGTCLETLLKLRLDGRELEPLLNRIEILGTDDTLVVDPCAPLMIPHSAHDSSAGQVSSRQRLCAAPV